MSSDLDQHFFIRLKDQARAEVWEHWLACVFAPKEQRLPVLVLAMMAQTIRTIPTRVSEPSLATIRLAWWRDVVTLDYAVSEADSYFVRALAYVCQKDCDLQDVLLRLLEIEAEGIHSKPKGEDEIRRIMQEKDGYEVLARHKMLSCTLDHQAVLVANDFGFIQATARIVFSKWHDLSRLDDPMLEGFVKEAERLAAHYLKKPFALPKAALVPMVAQRQLMLKAGRGSKRLPSRLGVLWKVLML